MNGVRIVLTAFTVASWGGLHENVIGACKALHEAGAQVMFIGTEGAVCDAARRLGIPFVIGVDWNTGIAAVRQQAIDWHPDLVFSQPFNSRELGQEISEATGASFVVMFHGIAHDNIHLWHDGLDRLLVTAPSIGAAVEGYSFVPRDKITVIPNGIDDAILERPTIPLSDKLTSPVVAIVGRLSHDKLRMIDGGIAVARTLESDHGIHAQVRVLGDGPRRGDFERRLRAALGADRVAMDGWLDPAEVPGRLGSSLICVSAGRGALQSLAVGTPVYGAGARASVGISGADALEVAADCNFGDYVPAADLNVSVAESLREIMADEPYGHFQKAGRDVVSNGRTQSEVDRRLVSELSAVVN
ncbi:hypothetical protein GCM10027063_33160 [Promicromonospora xylanilytica]